MLARRYAEVEFGSGFQLGDHAEMKFALGFELGVTAKWNPRPDSSSATTPK